MCMHIPRARHQFPPLCPVLLSVLGIGWWVTLAPCVHHHIWGGGADTGTQHKQVSHASWRTHSAGTETANTLQCNDGQSQPYIRDTVSRDCHAGVSCHYIVTSSSPGQRSRHYPDKIISDIWIAGWCIKWRCSLGNYSSELIRCAILLNVTLPVLWNDVTPQTCQTLQSVQCPKHSTALLISFISMWAHLIAVNICVNSTDL